MTAFRILGYEYQRQSIKETVLSVVTWWYWNKDDSGL
jgi:hypothetical protein